MAFKPVGVDSNSLFPIRVMNALKQLFLQPDDVAEVATSGKYSDLDGAPSIPSSASDIDAEPEGLSGETKSLLKSTYVEFVDQNGNPLAADKVRIVVDTTSVPKQVSDIVVVSV